MKFGLSADGKVVCGVDAIEITVESCYALCKKAPYGAREKVRAFMESLANSQTFFIF